MRTLTLLVVLALAGVLGGCGAEDAAQSDAAAPPTAAPSDGDPKAGTDSQLSINPDYKKEK